MNLVLKLHFFIFCYHVVRAIWDIGKDYSKFNSYSNILYKTLMHNVIILMHVNLLKIHSSISWILCYCVARLCPCWHSFWFWTLMIGAYFLAMDSTLLWQAFAGARCSSSYFFMSLVCVPARCMGNGKGNTRCLCLCLAIPYHFCFFSSLDLLF